MAVSKFVLVYSCLVLVAVQSSTANETGLGGSSCSVKGEEGVCVHMFQCLSSKGRPAAVCRQGFLFGTCCLQGSPATTSSSTEKLSLPTESISTTSLITDPTVSTDSEDSSMTTEIPITKRPVAVSLHKHQECGRSRGINRSSKIHGGSKTRFAEFPWQVSIRKAGGVGEFNHHCGGSILSSRWILTAAHCIHSSLKIELRVRAGEYNDKSDAEDLPHQQSQVRRKILHPDFDSYTYENDLAMIELEEPLAFDVHVQPICLPEKGEISSGLRAVVTGWGRLTEQGDPVPILQKVKVPLVPNKECEDVFANGSSGRREYIPKIFICAGYPKGGGDACDGDSGGPLQVQGDDGRWVVVGVVSWGKGCGQPNKLGVYTRVTEFIDWINKTTA